uniref:Envelope glycoprotein M n=1 Tax=Canid alphaherpesvirus 1 TaxID=170325 RepID=A0A7T7DFJ2_9ALPH|nr:envelope glycoprotein M [Canid alphaherpesvirus 1]
MMSPYEVASPTKVIGNIFDNISWRTWLIQMFSFVLVSVTLFITLLSASIPQSGFPCFYGSVVNYNLNTSFSLKGKVMNSHLIEHVQTVFLETPTTVTFFYFISLTMVIISLFFITSAFIIYREFRNGAIKDSLSKFSTMISPPATILFGTLSSWLLQSVIILLSHKLLVLAAVTYTTHYFFLILFCVCFTSLGTTSSQYTLNIHLQKKSNLKIHRLVGPTRSVMINLIFGVLGISTVIVSLMIGIILNHSFHTNMWQSVAVATGFFIAFSLIFMILSEVIFSYYSHILIGPSFSILVASGAFGVSINDYFKKFYNIIMIQHSSIIVTIKVLIGLIAVTSIVMLFVRIVRSCLYHQKKKTNFYGNVQKAKKRVRKFIDNKRHRKSFKDQALLSDTDDEVIYENVANEIVDGYESSDSF